MQYIEKVKKYFKNAKSYDRLTHAYLIECQEELTRANIPNIIINELTKDEDIRGRNPDVAIIDSEGNNIISIDQIREAVVDDVQIRPVASKYKIYIINNADRMNESAQNALLKTLEEPPNYVIIIMTTRNKDLLLSTILSRAFIINIPRICEDELRLVLKNSNIDEKLIQGLPYFFLVRIGNNDDAKIINEIRVKLLSFLISNNFDLFLIKECISLLEKLNLKAYLLFELMGYYFGILYKVKFISYENKLDDLEYKFLNFYKDVSIENLDNIMKAISKSYNRLKSNITLDYILIHLIAIIRIKGDNSE